MTASWRIDKSKKQAAYLQIIDIIIDAIQTGSLMPSDKLPAERTLAETFGVNRSTVVKALDELASLGWISRKQGSGTRVLEGRWGSRQAPLSSLRKALNSPYLHLDPFVEEIEALRQLPKVLDLYSGDLPADLIPSFQLPPLSWEQILAEERYNTPTGYTPLQQTIKNHLEKNFDLPLKGQTLLITSGSTQGIALLMQVFLQAGDAIATEDPSFLFALPLFSSISANIIGVEQDEEGMIPHSLAQVLKEQKIKFVYLNPTFQNPTGRTMGLSRRQEIIDICQRYQVPIIEDDAASELSLSGNLPKLKQLAPETVIYLGSLSKIFSSSIKIGWLLAPEKLIEKIAKAKKRMALETDIFPQLLANTALLSPDYPKQQTALITALRKRDALLTGMITAHAEDWQMQKIQGGLYHWLIWRHQSLTRKEWHYFLDEKLLIAPSFLFSNRTNALRLNYSRVSEMNIQNLHDTFTRVTQRLKE